MTRFIALGVVLALAAFLGFAATLPDTFLIQRSLRINAAPGKLYEQIEDFHRWSAWSPYEKLDPAMKKTFSGAQAGPGAVYEWQGNDKAGSGRETFLRAVPPRQIVAKVDFSKPFEGHYEATFTLEPSGDATTVTWAMSGPSPYLHKVMSLVLNLDHVVGKDFETGLANLKSIAEK